MNKNDLPVTCILLKKGRPSIESSFNQIDIISLVVNQDCYLRQKYNFITFKHYKSNVKVPKNITKTITKILCIRRGGFFLFPRHHSIFQLLFHVWDISNLFIFSINSCKLFY